jgi:hypothetical protein
MSFIYGWQTAKQRGLLPVGIRIFKLRSYVKVLTYCSLVSYVIFYRNIATVSYVRATSWDGVLTMKRKGWNYSGLLFNQKKKTFDRWIGNFIS